MESLIVWAGVVIIFLILFCAAISGGNGVKHKTHVRWKDVLKRHSLREERIAD